MNINSVSGSNQYIQEQTPGIGIAGSEKPLANEPKQDVRDTTTNQDRSNEAYQVSITEQARQTLRAEQTGSEQTAMEAKPIQEGSANSYSNTQGPKQIIDLVA